MATAASNGSPAVSSPHLSTGKSEWEAGERVEGDERRGTEQNRRWRMAGMGGIEGTSTTNILSLVQDSIWLLDPFKCAAAKSLAEVQVGLFQPQRLICLGKGTNVLFLEVDLQDCALP